MKWIPATKIDSNTAPIFKVGDKIRLYGTETTIHGFCVSYNDALEKYETIILTDGRGDPFERSLNEIEWLDESDVYDTDVHDIQKGDKDIAIQSGGEITEAAKGLGTCISCGSPTDKWNVCDNCWDEVPKHLKKQLIASNEDWKEKFIEAMDDSTYFKFNEEDYIYILDWIESNVLAPLQLQVQELKEENEELNLNITIQKVGDNRWMAFFKNINEFTVEATTKKEAIERLVRGSVNGLYKKCGELQSKISSLELQPKEGDNREKWYEHFKENFLAHADRLLRDKGMSSVEVFDCLELAFQDRKEIDLPKLQLRDNEKKYSEEDRVEILENNIGSLNELFRHVYKEGVLSAMQQYAEQEAVGFNNWLYESEYHYDNDGWYRIDEVGFKRYSLEELYTTIYLQSKIK